jgi:mannosyltransferase
MKSLTERLGLPKRSRSATYQYALIGLTVLGAAIRLYRLGQRSLWFDESLSVLFASQPIGVSIQSMLEEGLQHSPLFYILLRPFVSLPARESLVRLLPAAAGIATIPAIGELGRKLYSRRVGILASAIVALNPFHVWYSREARMYSLIGLLAVLVMICFFHIVYGRPRARHWIGLSLSLGAALNTHPFAHFLPLIQLVFFLVTFRKTYPLFRRWTASIVGAYLTLVPWIIIVLRWGNYYGSSGTSRLAVPTDLLSTVWDFSFGSADRLTLWGAIALFAFIAMMVAGFVASRQRSVLMGSWLFVPILGAFLLSLHLPMYMDRYLIVAFPAYVLLVAIGVDSLKLPALRIAAGISILTLTAAGLSKVFFGPVERQHANWRVLGQVLSEEADPHRDIIATLHYQDLVPLHFYYEGDTTIVPLVSFRDVNLPAVDLSSSEPDSSRLWLIIPHLNPTEHLFLGCIPFDEKTYTPIERVREWRGSMRQSLVSARELGCLRLEMYGQFGG